MIFNYGDQTLDLKPPKHVLMSVSGGLDSACLLYLLCENFPDVRITPVTGQDVTAPMDFECAIDVISFCRELFPNANIDDHETYTFDIMDPEWRKYSASKREEEMVTMPDGTKVDRCTGLSGLVKVLMKRDADMKMLEKYPEGVFVTGMTGNPPISEMKKYDFYDVAERRRDSKDLNPWSNDKRMYQPLVNVDKKFVSGFYFENKLMDTLYKYTSSCVGNSDETNGYTQGCGVCFWCQEKKWAFEC